MSANSRLLFPTQPIMVFHVSGGDVGFLPSAPLPTSDRHRLGVLKAVARDQSLALPPIERGHQCSKCDVLVRGSPLHGPGLGLAAGPCLMRVVSGLRHLGKPVRDVDGFQGRESLIAELCDSRRQGLQQDLQRTVLAVPLKVLAVEINDNTHGVALIGSVSLIDLHQLTETVKGGEVDLALWGVIGSVGKADVLALEVGEVPPFTCVVADAGFPALRHDSPLGGQAHSTPYPFPFPFP